MLAAKCALPKRPKYAGQLQGTQIGEPGTARNASPGASKTHTV